MEEIRLGTAPDQNLTTLHYARGTKLVNEGVHVLEFDIAGTGFRHPRKDYKGLKANKSIKETSQKYRKAVAEYGEGYQVVDEKGTRKKHVHSKTKVKEITVDGTTRTIQKTRITMAGSLASMGLDGGDYSMKKNAEGILFLGKQYIQDRVREAKEANREPEPIRIMLKGHSKGGVAIKEGAEMLNYWLHYESGYDQKLIDKVSFEISQYDPVAGLDANRGLNEKGDYYARESMLTHGEHKLKPLGDKGETTVFYGIQTNRPNLLFHPQQIKGAKRIIINPLEHSSGFQGYDKTQVSSENQQRLGNKFAYTDAKTGHTYRGSSINELPEGVYYMDEMNHLIRAKSSREVERFIDQVTRRAGKQNTRHNVIKEASRDWFERHPENNRINYAKVQRLVSVMKELDGGLGSKEFKNMRDSMYALGKCAKRLSETHLDGTEPTKEEMDEFKNLSVALSRQTQTYINAKAINPSTQRGQMKLALAKEIREMASPYVQEKINEALDQTKKELKLREPEIEEMSL